MWVMLKDGDRVVNVIEIDSMSRARQMFPSYRAIEVTSGFLFCEDCGSSLTDGTEVCVYCGGKMGALRDGDSA